MKNFLNFKILITALIIGFAGTIFGTSLFAQGSHDRMVVITVQEDGTYNVEPYVLVVPERASNVPIRFELEAANYEFMSGEYNGFSIQPDDGNFKVNGLSQQNKRLHLLDFNRVAQGYYYTITLVNPATGETLLIDPRVENGGGGTND